MRPYWRVELYQLGKFAGLFAVNTFNVTSTPPRSGNSPILYLSYTMSRKLMWARL